MTQSYRWTIRLSLLTIPLLFIAVFFAGGGHGTYIPAMGLFPVGLLGTLLFDRITIPFVVLAIIQYPIYGFIIDKVIVTNKSKIVLPLLLLLHILLAVIIMKLTGENWR